MAVGRPQKENFYLKGKFTSYLQGKDLAPSTIRQYSFDIGLFLAWIDKEEIRITKPDVLKHLEYLKNERKQQNITRSHKLLALNHYFTFLYTNGRMAQNPCSFLKIRGKQKTTLYRIYTPEELQTLYDNFYILFVKNFDDSHIPKSMCKKTVLSKQRNAVIVNILVHQGATTKEIDRMLLKDLDLMNATLKIRGGKKGKDRTLPLEATQIGILTDYLQNIRPKLLEYHTAENELLFLLLPSQRRRTRNEGKTNVFNVFEKLAKDIKSIDRNFLSFNQIRASVITNWFKVHGLRKTQVMAGHRNIRSTESYRMNDLEQLTDDIDKLHPF